MKQPYAAVVLGASAGGLAAVTRLLRALPHAFPLPLILCQHIHASTVLDFAAAFPEPHPFRIKEADEKEWPKPGTLYIAPAAYHLLIELDESFSLSNEDPVNWARPSIDVLFETAAEAYGERLIGVLLTGANHDGARGLQMIRRLGGLTLVQDPSEAAVPTMPQAAIGLGAADAILTLEQISRVLIERTARSRGVYSHELH